MSLASFALQHGAPPELTGAPPETHPDGSAAGPLGRLFDESVGLARPR